MYSPVSLLLLAGNSSHGHMPAILEYSIVGLKMTFGHMFPKIGTISVGYVIVSVKLVHHCLLACFLMK